MPWKPFTVGNAALEPSMSVSIRPPRTPLTE